MLGILEAKGDNTTPLKHMGKAKLRKEGKLPISLRCPYQLHKDSKKFLVKHQLILEREEKWIAAVEKKKKADKAKKKLKAAEKKIANASAVAAQKIANNNAAANSIAMVDAEATAFMLYML